MILKCCCTCISNDITRCCQTATRCSVTEFNNLIVSGNAITVNNRRTLHVVHQHIVAEFKRNNRVLQRNSCSRFDQVKECRCKSFRLKTTDICFTRSNLNSIVCLRRVDTARRCSTIQIDTIIDAIVLVLSNTDIKVTDSIVTRLIICSSSKFSCQFIICTSLNKCFDLRLIDSQKFQEVLISIIVNYFLDE